jgi:hypothetical protein
MPKHHRPPVKKTKKRLEPTPAQISSLRAITSRYGVILRQHQHTDGTIILHCQRPNDFSAKLFRIDKSGLTTPV